MKIIIDGKGASVKSGVNYAAGDGVSIEDNIINITTPVRGMTQSEYDSLSEEEKAKGLIIITDAESNGSRSSGNSIELAPEMHRVWFRGKNLGNSVTNEQLSAIREGSFIDLFLGDYWVINDITWRIVDIDYWLYCGSTEFKNHHLVIMPDTCLYPAKMNDTNTTEGGYVNSAMYKTNLEQAKTMIQNTFGQAVLTHKELLVNTVLNGRPSGIGWYDSTVELPSEIMMYGSSIFTHTNDETTIPRLQTINKSQLSLFQISPKFIVSDGIVGNRTSMWLRDIVSSSSFAYVNSGGSADQASASYSSQVRPVFAIG